MRVSTILRLSGVVCLTGLAIAVADVPQVGAQSPGSRANAKEVAARTADDDSVRIDLRPTAILEGHNLQATVKVQPRAANRLLAVRIDAPTFYASTERELMGDSSQRTFTFTWEKLPAGWYRVEAVVTDAAGRARRAFRDFQVHGGSIDGDVMPSTQVGRRGRRGRR